MSWCYVWSKWSKAKDLIFEQVQKTIKEFILIGEEKKKLTKEKGESFLTGDEKKKAVIGRLSEWVKTSLSLKI